MLATGTDIAVVGISVYGCDPLQVSAMTLSASGCGRDAAYGTVGYAVIRSGEIVENPVQMGWLSAFAVVEMVRIGKHRDIDIRYWEALGFNLGQDRGDLIDMVKTMVRRGHTLSWIL